MQSYDVNVPTLSNRHYKLIIKQAVKLESGQFISVTLFNVTENLHSLIQPLGYWLTYFMLWNKTLKYLDGAVSAVVTLARFPSSLCHRMNAQQ